MSAVHPADSVVYGLTYSTPAMRAVFDEAAVQQRRLDVEAALALAQAELGMIPRGAADEIAAHARIEEVGLEAIAEIFRETQNDIVALVRALGRRCSPFAREYIHYGATTQDITITSLALLIKDAMGVLQCQLGELEQALAARTREHRHTLMVGRTHGQHALPITFGFKTAQWAVEVRMHRRRLRELAPRVLVGSITGAVGSQAGFGEHGLELQRRVLQRLGLAVPPISPQPAEERYGEFLSALALIGQTAGRIGQELTQLQATEYQEVEEPFETGRQVSSSTMPHKRNPEVGELVKGIAYKLISNASAMLHVMQLHERDATRNPAEHLLVGESCLLASKALDGLTWAIRGLVVRAERMQANLMLTGGLIASEPVMLALARKTGRKQQAHEIVYRCAQRAFESGRPFRQVLLEDPEVAAHLTAQELERALDPAGYLGTVQAQIDQVLQLLDTPEPPWAEGVA